MVAKKVRLGTVGVVKVGYPFSEESSLPIIIFRGRSGVSHFFVVAWFWNRSSLYWSGTGYACC